MRSVFVLHHLSVKKSRRSGATWHGTSSDLLEDASASRAFIQMAFPVHAARRTVLRQARAGHDDGLAAHARRTVQLRKIHTRTRWSATTTDGYGGLHRHGRHQPRKIRGSLTAVLGHRSSFCGSARPPPGIDEPISDTPSEPKTALSRHTSDS